MQSGGANMSGAGKIVVSAAIGGTAEVLGGGTPVEFSTWRANHLAEVLYKQKSGLLNKRKRKQKLKKIV